MTTADDRVAHLPASSFVGTWRRFGQTGPVYEIIGPSEQPRVNETMLRVRVVDTEEEIDYRLAEILEDPREH